MGEDRDALASARFAVWAGSHLRLGERSDRLRSVGSPASEQSAHHAANQSNWTANPAVMMRTTAATTADRLVAIDFATGARLHR